jgi:cysteine sulfinate desulfinase
VHGRHDLQALGCDFYAFSAHKLYGPDGVGVLYGRADCLNQLRHWQFGGEMVRRADFHSADFHAAPMGLEAGTPPIAGVIGLGATLDYLSGLNAQAVREHEQALLEQLVAGLSVREGVRLLGEPQAALASFVVDDVHHADLAQLLGEQGIAVRGGNHCAMPLMQRLGVPGAIRVSLGLYNDGEDLSRLFTALDQALEILR